MNDYENPTLYAPQRTEDIILGAVYWGLDIDGTAQIPGQEFEFDD
jgi:hypothetical protein